MVSIRIENDSTDALPEYAGLLKSYHREFAPELRSLVNKLPLKPGSSVLEVAAGDGAFAVWLSERVGPQGAVTAIDISPAWLMEAFENIDAQGQQQIVLEQADAVHLPYEDSSFNFVWCAQSLYSLPRIQECLAEMARVTCSGGHVALLENDSMHHVLLPWPADLELHILAAEQRAFRATASQPAKYYVGRWLSRLLRKAGLRGVQERSFAYTRQQPLTPAAQEYFACHLSGLRERVSPWLKPNALKRFEQLIDPASRRCLWKQSDFVAVCIDRVVWGEKR